MNVKRMIIALVIGALSGVFCAYGTMNANVPGLVITTGLLATIFYNRLMMGLVVGLAENVKIIKGELSNAALRGAILGAVVSTGIGMFGGGVVLVIAGTIYGIIADVLATKYGR